MGILDPEGVQFRIKRRLRRRQYFARGPDYLWHMDSYDKLKRYGLCINGCMDGFSRQVIWLNAYTTSSDPRVIAGYYIEAIRERRGYPSLIRGDKGTGNGHVAQMQEFLSKKATFLFGRSTGNQRIEMFWSFVRKQSCQFWMDALASLTDGGLFEGDFLDVNLLQFCFLSILQKELDVMARTWNTHLIRPTKNQNCPHGRPVVMYMLPASYNTRSFLHPVEEVEIHVCKEECIFRKRYPWDQDVHELCTLYMNDKNLEMPASVDEGLKLYTDLRETLNRDLSL